MSTDRIDVLAVMEHAAVAMLDGSDTGKEAHAEIIRARTVIFDLLRAASENVGWLDCDCDHCERLRGVLARVVQP